MLNLGLADGGWKEVLPGIEFRFLPIAIKAVRAARRAAGAVLRADPDDFQEASDALSRELLRWTVAEWRGNIAGPDGEPITPATMLPVIGPDGEPLVGADSVPVTEPAIEAALRNVDLFEGAERAHVAPWLNRDREGNGSAGSSNGTSRAETPAPNTATDPAPTPPPASGAKPTTTGRPARTGGTNRKRKKASSSSMC